MSADFNGSQTHTLNAPPATTKDKQQGRAEDMNIKNSLVIVLLNVEFFLATIAEYIYLVSKYL